MLHIELPSKHDTPLIVLTSVVSALFMLLFNVFSFIPLQIIAIKKGYSAFIIATVLSLVVSLLLWFRGDRFIDIISPIGFFFALCVLNAYLFGFEIPAWKRIIASSFISFLGTMLVFAVQSSEITVAMLTILEAAPELGANLALILPGNGPEEWLNSILEISYRSIALSSAIPLLLTYIIGRGIARGSKSLMRSLDRFSTPNKLVWGITGSILGIMIFESLGVSIFAYVAWNIFLIIALLYCITGLSIAHKNLKNSPTLFVILIITIFVPGINFLVIIGLLILGIVSIWIPQINSQKERVEYEGDS